MSQKSKNQPQRFRRSLSSKTAYARLICDSLNVAPRSGLTWKHLIDVGAGVIDTDYRGPVGVILFNPSDTDFEVKAGDRIAQLIIEKIITPQVTEVDDLDATVRGVGGFGSTDGRLNIKS